MSNNLLTVIKKSDPKWGQGQTQAQPQPSSSTNTVSPTVSPSNAQTLQPPKKTITVTPKGGQTKVINGSGPSPQQSPQGTNGVPSPPPMLSEYQQQISGANDLLDRSEGRATVHGVQKPYGAHARKEHVGRKGLELESRNKKYDGAYLNKYEQNKSLAMAMSTNKGKSNWQNSKKPEGIFDSYDQPKLTPWMTSPIVRNVEKTGTTKSGKPIYDHFNAKINKASGKFTQDNGMKEGRRVQTLFGTDHVRLPKPLPGGQLPSSVLKLGGINKQAKGQLRPTTTAVKGSVASDTLGSNSETLPSTQDGLTARPELGHVVDPPKQHEPVGESTNAPSPTPLSTEVSEAPSTEPSSQNGEVSQLTEGGGNEVGTPSEGLSTDKTVENTPTVQQPLPAPTKSTNPPKKQPGKPKFTVVKGNNKKKKHNKKNKHNNKD